MQEDDKSKNLRINVHDAIHVQEAKGVNLEIKKIIKRTADVLEKTNEILVESSKSQSKQQILLTLIGSFLGFFFAVILFFITDYIKEINEKEQLNGALIQECKYNIIQINRTIDDFNYFTKNFKSMISNLKEGLRNRDYKAFEIKSLEYSHQKAVDLIEPDIRTTFFEKAFNNGLLYEVLSFEQIPTYNYFTNFAKWHLEQANSIKSDLKNFKIEGASEHIFSSLDSRMKSSESAIARYENFRKSIELLINSLE